VSADKSQKTEKPTPKRLKKAREEGQIPRSPEVASWVGLLVAVFLVRVTFTTGSKVCRGLITQTRIVAENPDPATALRLLADGLVGGVKTVAPLLLGLLLSGVALSIAQGGLHPSGKKLKPNFKRLNPMKGLKRAFGTHGAWEAAKALGKTGILALLLYRTIDSVLPLVKAGTAVPLMYVLHVCGDTIFKLGRDAALAGIVMAGLDYALQRRRIGKSLMMSKQEIKDEHRNSDGDPMVKSARRSRHLAMSRNRMMAEVAQADVVVVNPTHVAVALRYDPTKGAPRVVAKGAGRIASRIRQLAEENRVPMVADIPLARTLHRVCDVGQEIPLELYTAVARILAFIFALKARGVAAGVHRRAPTPETELAGIQRKRRRRGAQLPQVTVR
jgi:flagellar biosynthetic protein FlhB